MKRPWVLYLNDMRMPKIEYAELAVVAPTRERIMEILAAETVEPYRDGQWAKTFRQGGPLEWFNPPPESFGQVPQEGPSAQEVADRNIHKMTGAVVCEWPQ